MAKRAVEQTGLIPRSIIRTFERFKKQLFPGVEMLVIQEFRISRYQVIVSIQALLMRGLPGARDQYRFGLVAAGSTGSVRAPGCCGHIG